MEAFVTQHSGGVHVLAWLNGSLVGHASWVLRQLQSAGLPLLQNAYVEAVCAHPDYQRIGIGTTVMRQMAQEIKDFELAALATGSVGFYTRLGWELWRGKTAIRIDEGLLDIPFDTPIEGVMILRLAHTPSLDLDSLITTERHPGERR
jgi:aminoglycoside 2'-N-acetyltransferase I